MWRIVEDIRIRRGLAGYFMHYIDKCVQRLLRLGLGRLYHKGLVEEQREVDSRGVEAEIEQALRYIEGSSTGLACRRAVVDKAVEDEFVFTDGRDRELIGVLQAFLDIVGAEGRELAGHLYILLSEHKDVGIRAQNHSEIAHKGRDATGRCLRRAHDRELAVLQLFHPRDGQAVRELFADADGTGPGAASAVGRREGFMEIEVHHVEAHVAGTDRSEQRVHVRAVVIEQAAAFVDHGRDFLDVLFEKTEGVRVGHHDAGDVRAKERPEGLDVDQAVRAGLDLDYLEAADRRRGGVGSMGAVRDDYLRTGGIPAKKVIIADYHQAGELAVGSGAGIEREALHSGNGGECLLHLIVNLERALDCRLILKGMQALEGGHRGYLFVDFRVVLHSTAAQRVEAGINSEIHLGEIGIMSDEVRFAYFRKDRGLRAQQPGRDLGQAGLKAVVGKGIGSAPRLRKFENKFIVVFHG